MPAVSADTVALPRIPTVDPTAADRPVVSVTTAPSGFEGEGFPVQRAFAGVDLAALDPFVHMDQMGEVDYASRIRLGTARPSGGTTGWGPGLATREASPVPVLLLRPPTATHSRGRA
jgi:hypothetical protein